MTQEQLAEMLAAAYKRTDKYNATIGVVLSAVAIAAGFVLFGDALPRIADTDWKLAGAAAVGISAAALFCLLGLSSGPMHAHLNEPELAESSTASLAEREQHSLELTRRLAQHVIMVNGVKAAVLRGAAVSALVSLVSAYCAVVLSITNQGGATEWDGGIFGWVLFAGSLAALLWFTYRFAWLAHRSRDQVLSDAEETRHLIALAKYKRMLVKK